MKKCLLLALLLVVSLGGVAMASGFTESERIDFKVIVDPWVIFEFAEPPELKISGPNVEGESTATGTITSNIPITISLQSSRFQYNQADLNNWFRFDYKVGITEYKGVELGSRRNTQHIKPGVTPIVATLRSRIPEGRDWYDLEGDKEYVITVTATVTAQ
ncbi:MAG: hypothetical protein GX101_07400 [Firmicutes bacterium]|nr:hypothetical protein [Bacillota bacterium]NLO66502.1 hypothetical protein [Bacillota bacterium]